MIELEAVQAVFLHIRTSWPEVDVTPRAVRALGLDMAPDFAIIASEGGYRLRISRECFEYGNPETIAAALRTLDFARWLRERKSIFLGAVIDRADPALEVLASRDDWYLAAWPPRATSS